MTIDELFNLAQSRAAENVQFVIDENLRIISVPQTAAVFGVEYDKDVNTVGFMINRYYSEVDLSEFAIRVSFENANNEMDFFDATDIVADESTVTFSWTMGASAFKYQGTIHFAVNFIKADADGTVQQAYNTTIAEGQCLVGLNVNSADVPESDYSDLIIHIQQQIQLAGNTAVLQVRSEGTAQTTAVTNAGTAQVQAVNDAAEQALGNISAAAPALPAVSAAAAWQSVTAKPDGTGYNLAAMAPIEATIRPTVTGNPAVCKDSAAWAFQGLKIYGKSTQDSTPSPENQVPIVSAGDGGSITANIDTCQLLDYSKFNGINQSGVSATADKFGIITLNGLASTNAFIRISFLIRKGEKIKLKAYNPVKNENVSFKFSALSGGDATGSVILSVPNASGEFQFEEESAFFNIRIQSGTTLNDFVLRPMLYKYGNGAWEPYKEPQTITISTPNGLPGIPVESGGNFTDAEGQQLVCNVVDYGTEIIYKFCKQVVVTKEAVASIYATSNATIVSCNTGVVYDKTAFKKRTIPAICNKFLYSTKATSSLQIGEFTCLTVDDSGWGGQARVLFAVPMSITSAQEFIEYVGDNLTAIFVLDEPELDPIPAEELAAYRALTTYDGTTVISTAEPVAGIEARYILDGTAAWNKFTTALAQLSAANTQTSQVVNTMLGASK